MPTRPNSKPLIKHAQIIRLPRLLDMLYTPAELAEEIAVNVDTIYRTYLRNGLPHIREKKRVWIHGKTCAEWMRRQVRKKKRAIRLPDGYAYCLHCRSTVGFDAHTSRPVNPNLLVLSGPCSVCGQPVHRFQSAKSNPSPSRRDGEGALYSGREGQA